MTTARQRGCAGEEYAARMLRKWGWRILEQNAHSVFGEVDIVAVRGELLAFVEVKTRRRRAMVSGKEAVTKAKQTKILRTALLWMQAHPEWDLQPRFDVFVVELDAKGCPLHSDYIEGAFDGEGYETAGI